MKINSLIQGTAFAAGILALLAPTTDAQGGFRGGPPQGGGFFGPPPGNGAGGPPGGNSTSNGYGPPGGQGPPGGRGPPGGNGTMPAFVNITCSSPELTSCNLPMGDQGFFVCRTRYDPRSGTNKTFPMCIQSDRAFETDVCGCCGGTCPTPCDQCSCTLPYGNVTGVEVLVNGMSQPLCVPPFDSAMMVATSNGNVTCNTVCT